MIKGSIVAIVTPMFEDGSLDRDSLRKLIDWHVAEGTDGIVIVGTTGESATVSPEEHCELIKLAVDHVAGRIPVIAGSGGNSTVEAIALTRHAKEVGADASLQVVPYYNRPTQEGMYRHFKAIAEAVDLPVILYNVPGRTVADMSNETVLRLAPIAISSASRMRPAISRAASNCCARSTARSPATSRSPCTRATTRPRWR
jgi:4-hydroxy-tetrahydrodipicolinate synthase